MNNSDEGVCLRRKVLRDENGMDVPNTDETKDLDADDSNDVDAKEVRLTLMEEILLIGLKEREGHLSFWNDSVSSGLRGCILVELALRGRIDIEAPTMRRRCFQSRAVIVKNDVPTGDAILDEALKLISTNPPENVHNWIDYLSGDTWNPFKLPLQIRNVRERLAKNLVEKGICKTQKLNFFVFDMTTHPLTDSDVKKRIVSRIHEGLINRWPTADANKIDKRLLCLVLLAHYSEVLESILSPLSDVNYELVRKRINIALRLDFLAESLKEGACPIVWAVLDAFSESN